MRIKASIATALLVTSSIFCLAASASATTQVGAAQGKPVVFSQTTSGGSGWSCFSEDSGGVKNSGVCAAGPSSTNWNWEIPLPITSSGSHTIAIATKGAYSGNPSVSCEAASVMADGTNLVTSGWVTPTASPQTISITMSVPAGGYLFVVCGLEPYTPPLLTGGEIFEVSWN